MDLISTAANAISPAKIRKLHYCTQECTGWAKLSKYEPLYTCSICNKNLLTYEIGQHTEDHIQDGILKALQEPETPGAMPKGS